MTLIFFFTSVFIRAFHTRIQCIWIITTPPTLLQLLPDSPGKLPSQLPVLLEDIVRYVHVCGITRRKLSFLQQLPAPANNASARSEASCF